MANEKEVSIIRQGVGIWNQWRKRKHSSNPDLSEADLKGTDLTGARQRQYFKFGTGLPPLRIESYLK